MTRPVLLALFGVFLSAPVVASNSATRSPHDSAVFADVRAACADEIKAYEAANPHGQWRSSWSDQFRRFTPPEVYLERVKNFDDFLRQRGIDPTKDPLAIWGPLGLYLKACMAVTYSVQSSKGIGSGKEALEKWRELRARFQQSLSTGTTSATSVGARAAPAPASSPSTPVTTPTGSGSPTASGGANAGQAGGGRWPSGVEPGNLYVVPYDGYYATGSVLVAARNRAEAAEYVQTGLNKRAELYRLRRAETSQVHPNSIVECTGPNWGAVIVISSEQPGSRSREFVTAASCGARTPRDAIQNASRLCASKRGRPCSGRVQLTVSIGHSGAKPWSLWGHKKPHQPGFGSFPNANLFFAALGASTQQHTYDFVTSPEEAISQFGKACGAKEGRRNYASCWITSKNLECVMTINGPGDSLPNWQKCVDVKLTADGYVE